MLREEDKWPKARCRLHNEAFPFRQNVKCWNSWCQKIFQLCLSALDDRFCHVQRDFIFEISMIRRRLDQFIYVFIRSSLKRVNGDVRNLFSMLDSPSASIELYINRLEIPFEACFFLLGSASLLYNTFTEHFSAHNISELKNIKKIFDKSRDRAERSSITREITAKRNVNIEQTIERQPRLHEWKAVET